MDDSFLLTAGIFVTLLLIVGLVYTMIEFKRMDENPGQFRKDDDYPRVKNK
jgi:hypothetical protein